MYNTILIKRRLPGGAAGAPGSLSGGELAFNEVDSVLYYGSQAGVIPIGGSGHFATNSLVGSISADLQSQVTNLDSRVTSEVSTLNTTIQSVSSTLDARITSEIAAVIDMAPEALNTLNELASALGDDANFASNLVTTLGNVNSTIASVSSDLQTQIDNLESGANADVAALSAAIDAEESARIAADSALETTLASVSATLDSKIDSEVSTLNSTVQSVSSTLEAAIAAEESARIAADSAIETTLASVSATLSTDIDGAEQAAKDYSHANFLPLSGGNLTGMLTVASDISASGTITAAGGLEIGAGAGNATLYVGGGKVGIGTEAPNEELTVVGSISATESIFAADATFSGNVTVAEPSSSSHAATKNYVDTAIANLVDGAPALLDTLNELASAINDDENFAVTVANNIANVQTNVNNLNSTVQSVSSTLEAAIAAEESARIAADSAIETTMASVSATLDTKIDTQISSLSSTVDANFVEKVEADAVTLNGSLTVSSGLIVDTINASSLATFNSNLSGNGTSSTIYGFILDGGSF